MVVPDGGKDNGLARRDIEYTEPRPDVSIEIGTGPVLINIPDDRTMIHHREFFHVSTVQSKEFILNKVSALVTSFFRFLTICPPKATGDRPRGFPH